MSDAAPAQSALRMPVRTDLVDEAIARLDTLNLRHAVVRLDTETLRDLGTWLTDRGQSTADAFASLNAALGYDADDPVVSQSAF